MDTDIVILVVMLLFYHKINEAWRRQEIQSMQNQPESGFNVDVIYGVSFKAYYC